MITDKPNKICIVGGYTLDLYCAECDADRTCTGQTKAQAITQAIKIGWKIQERRGVAWCPTHAGTAQGFEREFKRGNL